MFFNRKDKKDKTGKKEKNKSEAVPKPIPSSVAFTQEAIEKKPETKETKPSSPRDFEALKKRDDKEAEEEAMKVSRKRDMVSRKPTLAPILPLDTNTQTNQNKNQ